MKEFGKKKFLLLTIGVLSPITLFTSQAHASSFGAEIFCTMRDGGNDHESSWQAAYSYIKKQKGGLFKVSPRQAASQIIETVIRDNEKYGYCIEYLNNLYPNRQEARDLKEEEKRRKKEAKEKKENDEKRRRLEKELEETNEIYTEDTFDR